MIERFKNFISKYIAGDSVYKPIIAIGVFITLLYILIQAINNIATIISGNIVVAMVGLIVIVYVANKILFGKKEEQSDIIVPNEKMLNYNYRIIRSNLFKIIPDIAVPFGLIAPSLPSKLTAPVRHTFLGKTALYHYIALINKDDGDVTDTDIISETIQNQINILLETGKWDSTEASTVIVSGIAYPRVIVHDVSVANSHIEISIAYANREYVKAHQANFAAEIDDVTDIRDLDEDDI